MTNVSMQIMYMLDKCRGRLGYSNIRREGNKVTRGARRIIMDNLKRTLTCGPIDGVVVSKLNKW